MWAIIGSMASAAPCDPAFAADDVVALMDRAEQALTAGLVQDHAKGWVAGVKASREPSGELPHAAHSQLQSRNLVSARRAEDLREPRFSAQLSSQVEERCRLNSASRRQRLRSETPTPGYRQSHSAARRCTGPNYQTKNYPSASPPGRCDCTPPETSSSHRRARPRMPRPSDVCVESEGSWHIRSSAFCDPPARRVQCPSDLALLGSHRGPHASDLSAAHARDRVLRLGSPWS